MMLTSACVCGGTISALDDSDIPDAVRRHQMTERHVLWRGGRPRPCPGDGVRGCLAWVLPSRERCQFDQRTLDLRGAA